MKEQQEWLLNILLKVTLNGLEKHSIEPSHIFFHNWKRVWKKQTISMEATPDKILGKNLKEKEYTY